MSAIEKLLKTNATYATILRQLKNRDVCPHAMLIMGPDELALKEFAKLIVLHIMCEGSKIACSNCPGCIKVTNGTHADVLSYPKQDKSFLVEDALEVADTMHILPYEGGKKVYVLAFGSNANAQSQNKLLKSIEEPARDVVFVLTATNEAGVLSTIKSRAIKFNIRAFSHNAILEYLQSEYAGRSNLELAASYSGGSLTSAVNYATDATFATKLGLVFDLLIKMTHSSNSLSFAARVQKQKGDFKNFVKLFNVVVGASLRASDVVTNFASEHKSILNTFGNCGLAKLIKLGNEVNERATRNANFNATIDYFILKILEIRHDVNKNSNS